MGRKEIKEYIFITFGIILVALAFEYLLAPNNLAAGGVTGLAIVINHYFPFISNGMIVMIVNIVLFVVAFIVIGGNFGAKTIYASYGLSLVMWIIEKFFKPFALTSDLILATVFGTLVSAVGMAIVFNYNASTGGTDILAKILNKFFHIAIGKSLLIVDMIITLAAAVTFGLDIGLYALVSVIGLGITIDRLIEGINTVKEVKIVSVKGKEISEFIMNKLGRGCTFIKGVGAYSNKDMMIVYAILGRNEFIRLREFLKEEDTNAFITVNEVHEVLGEGFMDLKEI